MITKPLLRKMSVCRLSGCAARGQSFSQRRDRRAVTSMPPGLHGFAGGRVWLHASSEQPSGCRRNLLVATVVVFACARMNLLEKLCCTVDQARPRGDDLAHSTTPHDSRVCVRERGFCICSRHCKVMLTLPNSSCE